MALGFGAAVVVDAAVVGADVAAVVGAVVVGPVVAAGVVGDWEEQAESTIPTTTDSANSR